VFGAGTKAALTALQRSEGLLPDGIVDPRTAKALGFRKPPERRRTSKFDIQLVSEMFPVTPLANLKRHLPLVLSALKRRGLTSESVVLATLATIRAESEGFEPIDEMPSRFNTSPQGHPFDLYDNRRDLGNRGRPDGERYKGRGFVQLTGRANYERYGNLIGRELVKRPNEANNPLVAAELLAEFVKSKEMALKNALLEDDLRAARKLVNGGLHGLDRFSEAYRTGERLLA